MLWTLDSRQTRLKRSFSSLEICSRNKKEVLLLNEQKPFVTLLLSWDYLW